MSTITLPAAPPVASAPGPYRMTADEFDRIAEGLNRPVELVDGYLVERPDMDPEHAMVTTLLRRFLDRMLGDVWHAREEKPVRADDYNERLPDVAVVPGTPRDYGKHHPKPGETALLVEVSWSTLYADRGEKQKLYASQGVPVYWIVNVKYRQVEVYTRPTPDGYLARTDYQDGDSVPVVIAGAEVGRVAVTGILPRIEPAVGGNGV